MTICGTDQGALAESARIFAHIAITVPGSQERTTANAWLRARGHTAIATQQSLPDIPDDDVTAETRRFIEQMFITCQPSWCKMRARQTRE